MRMSLELQSKLPEKSHQIMEMHQHPTKDELQLLLKTIGPNPYLTIPS